MFVASFFILTLFSNAFLYIVYNTNLKVNTKHENVLPSDGIITKWLVGTMYIYRMYSILYFFRTFVSLMPLHRFFSVYNYTYSKTKWQHIGRRKKMRESIAVHNMDGMSFFQFWARLQSGFYFIYHYFFAIFFHSTIFMFIQTHREWDLHTSHCEHY